MDPTARGSSCCLLWPWGSLSLSGLRPTFRCGFLKRDQHLLGGVGFWYRIGEVLSRLRLSFGGNDDLGFGSLVISLSLLPNGNGAGGIRFRPPDLDPDLRLPHSNFIISLQRVTKDQIHRLIIVVIRRKVKSSMELSSRILCGRPWMSATLGEYINLWFHMRLLSVVVLPLSNRGIDLSRRVQARSCMPIWLRDRRERLNKRLLLLSYGVSLLG
ncbi:uncharacterized protein LOC120189473 isoform X2 [Hibiscus syriacus]|uniref:uncharacterized protein LOC120189473 isoform X2 n=1 Tax=Hibiscus syriacus TaxID=106335 RepID=UPI001922AF59|nr:uncharacterized protein LOC120189473 isoform X2 [Hibiscus syriacus]